MLVGNKSDLKHLRAVPTEEAKSFAGAFELFPLGLRSDIRLSEHSGEGAVIYRDVRAGRVKRRGSIPDHPHRHLSHRLEQAA